MPPEFSASRLGPSLALTPHPKARHQATAKSNFSAGSLILAIPTIASILLPSEKGRRCDACHKISVSTCLRRCSGCASYWYCDSTCQNLDWSLQHKRICKNYNNFTASVLYQALQPHEKLDALLLSHLAAHIDSEMSFEDEGSPISTFMTLLPGPVQHPYPPPIAIKKTSISRERLYAMYSRFGNNNFAIHSHLNTIGHGIFPLASRLFNHSCLPNAATRYILTQGQPVRMEVVALREITPNEEICIPYLDPALLQTRQQILELSYGFKCECASCQFLQGISPVPEADGNSDLIVQKLRDYMVIGHRNTDTIPRELSPVFSESYITGLSEEFSKSSHEGAYTAALQAGVTLLDVYQLIYPLNYPQIGMHLLEMAKTAWNSSLDDPTQEHVARQYLIAARDILMVFGKEGDEGGPLEAVATLEKLLLNA
ncbi:hypothetical protein C8J56DRAFT_767329 [Mycena floridula]|nr:hypothetical protein C8J56DRAFT_767329 [Mycena floridula]